MELTIPAGCAVTLVVDGATFRLRTLAEARLVSDDEDDADAVWSVPVMVAGEALGLGEGRARFATYLGLVHVPARLVAADDGLVLEGLGTPQTTQRRMAVRQPIELPLLLRVPLNPPAPPLRGLDDDEDDDEHDHDGPGWDPDDVGDVVPATVGPVVTVTGSTLNVSAGGIMARLDRHCPELLPRHRGIIAELTLPDGEVVEAEMAVVELHHSTLRGPFTAISPRGRERLTRVIFAYEREALAERRRRQEMSDRVGGLPTERRGFGGL
ncbi:MAG TPA: hypothetical protein VFL94_14555 [Actinomycetales bacterium]|nr:hypothetical protein [Actinomycetales bacterium]